MMSKNIYTNGPGTTTTGAQQAPSPWMSRRPPLYVNIEYFGVLIGGARVKKEEDMLIQKKISYGKKEEMSQVIISVSLPATVVDDIEEEVGSDGDESAENEDISLEVCLKI
ncbi:hypothetical protein L1987_01332 [Smallanthus sonchifolius]|uniref:Uncharacterized protein n=1 Tax=Smallanthus sonchifolius TaxID=185202 RepID=A0ACB9K4X5_9ASTR|nr:hypothetical protein L1987_01332 [Smallanthus sonchifolius]